MAELRVYMLLRIRLSGHGRVRKLVPGLPIHPGETIRGMKSGLKRDSGDTTLRLFVCHLVVKFDIRGREIYALHKFAGFFGAVFTVHTRVFPFN